MGDAVEDDYGGYSTWQRSESKCYMKSMSANHSGVCEEVCCDPCDPCEEKNCPPTTCASNTIKIQAGEESDDAFHSVKWGAAVVQFQQSELFKDGYSQKGFCKSPKITPLQNRPENGVCFAWEIGSNHCRKAIMKASVTADVAHVLCLHSGDV